MSGEVWPVSLMCEVLEVSASGYFYWKRTQDGPGSGPSRFQSDESLLAHMRAIHAQIKGEYGWPRMHKELLAWGINSSMSRKGNCWDNAPTESFWGHLKVACVLGQTFATREQAKATILTWIAFYNHARLHSALGYLSPMQFEQRWLAARRKNAA
jgi:Integrase core domain